MHTLLASLKRAFLSAEISKDNGGGEEGTLKSGGEPVACLSEGESAAEMDKESQPFSDGISRFSQQHSRCTLSRLQCHNPHPDTRTLSQPQRNEHSQAGVDTDFVVVRLPAACDGRALGCGLEGEVLERNNSCHVDGKEKQQQQEQPLAPRHACECHPSARSEPQQQSDSLSRSFSLEGITKAQQQSSSMEKDSASPTVSTDDQPLHSQRKKRSSNRNLRRETKDETRGSYPCTCGERQTHSDTQRDKKRNPHSEITERAMSDAEIQGRSPQHQTRKRHKLHGRAKQKAAQAACHDQASSAVRFEQSSTPPGPQKYCTTEPNQWTRNQPCSSKEPSASAQTGAPAPPCPHIGPGMCIWEPVWMFPHLVSSPVHLLSSHPPPPQPASPFQQDPQCWFCPVLLPPTSTTTTTVSPPMMCCHLHPHYLPHLHPYPHPYPHLCCTIPANVCPCGNQPPLVPGGVWASPTVPVVPGCEGVSVPPSSAIATTPGAATCPRRMDPTAPEYYSQPVGVHGEGGGGSAGGGMAPATTGVPTMSTLSVPPPPVMLQQSFTPGRKVPPVHARDSSMPETVTQGSMDKGDPSMVSTSMTSLAEEGQRQQSSSSSFYPCPPANPPPTPASLSYSGAWMDDQPDLWRAGMLPPDTWAPGSGRMESLQRNFTPSMLLASAHNASGNVSGVCKDGTPTLYRCPCAHCSPNQYVRPPCLCLSYLLKRLKKQGICLEDARKPSSSTLLEYRQLPRYPTSGDQPKTSRQQLPSLKPTSSEQGVKGDNTPCITPPVRRTQFPRTPSSSSQIALVSAMLKAVEGEFLQESSSARSGSTSTSTPQGNVMKLPSTTCSTSQGDLSENWSLQVHCGSADLDEDSRGVVDTRQQPGGSALPGRWVG